MKYLHAHFVVPLNERARRKVDILSWIPSIITLSRFSLSLQLRGSGVQPLALLEVEMTKTV